MISLILYGRNDSYGYNLHKRAAISLNCMAEVLTDPDDEIIFVDYNTPDDFPTFPEAIQDTLTEKAKRLLRILRVRPKHHERFAAKTHLTALEPIARNVAIRRSNPKNRWILSTNTDMVFVPRRGKSLSEIASALPDGYYHLPRFEVPETLWESADRLHPHATIAAFEEWGRDYHLNEIVFAQDPEVRYDAPGDFQLMLRSDAWKIFGFNESMLLGWHVDSNMAKRLWLLRRHVGDVVQDLFGYHCDHTRQVTPMHKPQGTQNDLKVYFQLVRSAAVRKQAKTWGLAGEEVEELSLPATQSYATALRSATSRPLNELTTIRYAAETYNQIDYSAEHVLPFLADSVSSYPRATVLAWSGAKRSLLHGFARVWQEMGFSEPILVFAEDRWFGPDLPQGCVWASASGACARASIFIFDWGKPESALRDASWNFDRDPTIRQVARDFRSALRNERARVLKGSDRLRRFIGVNAINNAMEGVFGNRIGAARTPIATRIRQGFFVKTTRNVELSASVYIGDAGRRIQDGIVTLPGKQGYVFFGPYLDLDSALYSLRVEFADVRWPASNREPLTLDVVSNSQLIACREITKRDLASGAVTLGFHLSKKIADAPDWPRIEFRLRTAGAVRFKVTRVMLDHLGTNRAPAAKDLEIAPLLTAGPAGKRDGSLLHARKGVADLVAYGPYFWLPEGRYEAEFRFRVDGRTTEGALRAFVAYNLGRIALGAATIQSKHKGIATCIIPFKVSGEPPPPEFGLLEFLVWSRGTVTSSLLSLKVRPAKVHRARRTPTISDSGVLSLLSVKRAGRRFPGTIVALSGAGGVVFQSIRLPLPAGGQRFEMGFRQLRAGKLPAQTGLNVEAVSRGRAIARQVLTAKELKRGRVTFDFDVASTSWGEEVEIVLRSKGLVELEITSAELSERAAPRSRVQAPDEMVAISP